MQEVQKNIYFVSGEDKARFPYCNGLYLRGKEMRILIDAGMGKRQVSACVEKGIDLLILSHCHYDHRSTIKLIPDIPVWCHEKEVPYIESREHYFAGMGLARSGVNMEELQRIRFPDIRVSKLLSDGDCFDLGGLTLEIVHAPGHTPGHLAFSVDRGAVLFTSDVALTPFGPFYGNDFSDIDDFIATIRRLSSLKARQVITSHVGPLCKNIPERFVAYEEAIIKKDRTLLDALEGSCQIDDLIGRNLFFPFYYEPLSIIMWFEQVEIEKHLNRLVKLGKARKEGERYIRAS
ncbi:MAG: MBL fold metallo-hydrolase [Deltaproteobacteria bacterium]|nr:MBL fold metallo-hydrolase [Deltaproteobacteria bacterium]